MFKKDAGYYVLIILIFILLKFIYKFSDCNDLQFLLKPTSKIVGFISNSPSVFIPDTGYFHEKMNILINKSCSGFNFWILCLTLLLFSAANLLQNNRQKIAAIFILFIGTYFFTLLVNSSRILISFLVSKILKQYAIPAEWMHQATGTFVYLFFLISIYLTFTHIFHKTTFIKISKNEKPA